MSDIPHLPRRDSIAKSVVAKRFGPKKIEHSDMLGSWIRKGMTQPEAEQEAMIQM